MVRRKRLLVELALVGVLALLVFPGASSALVPTYVISLTSSGPSPAVLTTSASYGRLQFDNTDTVTHSIAFANGRCSVDIAPDAQFDCGRLPYVGTYAYTIDGTSQGQIVIDPASRRVSLRVKRHAVRLGSTVTLHGTLVEDTLGAPPSPGSPQPIIVIARPYRGHPFHRVGVVEATPHWPTKSDPFYGERWHLTIHPHAGMTYVAIASYQPKAGQIWERAVSKPSWVAVRG